MKMEDMARLAVFEQNIRDENAFSKTLHILLRFIETILEYPYDYENRALKCDYIIKYLKIQEFTDYLNYVGFFVKDDTIIYPNEQSLDKLRMAQVAIERKLIFTRGPSFQDDNSEIKPSLQINNKSKLVPTTVLTTNNNFLRTIEVLFNDVLKYEEDDLKQLVWEKVPVVSLQMKAVDRMRSYQMKLKSGEITGRDLSFDIAQLLELIGWFKFNFFNWVDCPKCVNCGAKTYFTEIVNAMTETEVCKVEIFSCKSCDKQTMFPRHNDPRKLLSTRCGRCGEWANCFAMLCRTLGYDTRYVFDTTDHVWCEVFDYDSNRWLHLDPCEATLDTPLMYEHGWKKKLSYVIAVSRDDIQDVTWRYSGHHQDVMTRRNQCTESELLNSLLMLRESRQRQVSETRRRYLTKRCLQELAELMVERKPNDYESHGRISGGEMWRRNRGEIGKGESYSFEFALPGDYIIKYYTVIDKYEVTRCGNPFKQIFEWSSGTYECMNIFRKEEEDWGMVYLAREDGYQFGKVSWRLCTNEPNVHFTSVAIRVTDTTYDNGKVNWTLQFDEDEPAYTPLSYKILTFQRRFRDLVISAELSGGSGDVAWQHAQLFRQHQDSDSSSFKILLVAKNIPNN